MKRNKKIENSILYISYQLFILATIAILIAGIIYLSEDIELSALLFGIGGAQLIIYIWDLKTHKIWGIF